MSEEFSQKPVVRTLPDTLYVYVPVTFDILKTKAARPDPFFTPSQGKKRQINFIDTVFREPGLFHISYDITAVNSYSKSPGYTSVYSDEFSALHSNLLSTLSRSFSDVKDNVPSFMVMLIVDTRNGVAIKNLFHFNDLKRVMTGAMPQEEYALRYMTDMVGDQSFIDNPSGKKLSFAAITWPEFISKQITYRVHFKYSRSSFPPSDNDVNEILKIVNDTMKAYDFSDFQTVQLENLATGETMAFDKEQLKTFQY